MPGESDSRQSRLVEIGPAGQALIASSTADVQLDRVAATVCARYLAGCGVGTLRVRDARVGAVAREARSSVTVVIVDDLPVHDAASDLDLHDEVARQVAGGANEALAIIRATLGLPARGTVPADSWALGNLTATRSVIARVDQEALEGYARGEESCGLLTGPTSEPRRVDGIVPMVNRANALHAIDAEAYPRTGRTYFDIDTLKFQTALRRGESQGRPVKVLYHSHVDAGAYFSDTDAEVARMGQGEPPWNLAYLVTSVVQGKVAGRALYVWDGRKRDFVESRLDIVLDPPEL
jgi:proteasome lid subunit RPN8/RPN11